MPLHRILTARQRLGEDAEESYYASMTDIMVGLLFIFVILLMYFAYQIHDTSTDTVSRAAYDEAVAMASLRQKERDDARSQRDRLAMLLSLAEKERDRSLADLARAHVVIIDQDALIAQQASELEGYRRRTSPLEDYFRDAAIVRTSMLRAVQKRLFQDGIKVEVNDTQGVLRLPEGILFESGRFDLPTEQSSATERDRNTLRALRALANGLDEALSCRSVHDELAAARRMGVCDDQNIFVEAILVEGHSDTKPLNVSRSAQVQSNHDLAGMRASRTLAALLSLEPRLAFYRSPDEEQVLAASGYGPDRPIASNDTELGRQQNRRIDVRILMFTPRSVEQLTDMETKVRSRVSR